MSDPRPLRNLLNARSGVHPALWPIVELVASVAAQLVLTPLLLHRLGTEQFAVWVIVQSLLLASATLSLGAGTALLPALAGARSRHDAQGAWAAIGLFAKRTARISLAGLAAIVVGIPLSWAYGGIVGLESRDLLLIAAAALVWVSANEFDSGFSSALKALGRFDTVAHMEVASRLVQVALTAAFVASGAPALVPVMVAAAVTASRAVWKYAALRKRWPRPPREHGASAANSVTREFSAAGVWVWLGMLSGLAFYAFDRWYVGAWLGSSVLAAYAVCSQIAQLPHAVASAAGQTLVPWAARRRDRLVDPEARHDARKIMLSATMFAVLPSVVLLLLLEPLLSLWISKQFASDHLWLARGLTVVSLLLSLNVPSFFLLFGFGQVRIPTLLVVLSGTVFVAGCLLASPSLAGVVALRGLFAVLSLSLVVYFMWTSGARG